MLREARATLNRFPLVIAAAMIGTLAALLLMDAKE